MSSPLKQVALALSVANQLKKIRSIKVFFPTNVCT